MSKPELKSDRKASAIQALREAIKKYGLATGPRLVREQYLDVPRATWHRYLKEVAATPMEQAIDTAKKAAAQLPAPPSPSYLCEKPVESRQNLDVMGKVHRMFSDAEMLRAYSVAIDHDTTDEVISDPVFFSKSIDLRGDVLELAVKTLGQVYEYERMQRQFDLIMEAIMEESPEVALRITERLARLNGELGMTIDARI